MRVQKRAMLASLIAITIAIAFSCGNESPAPPQQQVTTDPPDSPRPAPDLSHHRVHLDLIALAHMADVDHHGSYIDFGTPARAHWTMGRWHGGWLRDVSAGERDFTRMGTDGRIFFHLDQRGPITVRIRGRGLGSEQISVYANGALAANVTLGTTVGDHDVSIANGLAGENVLMLRASSTRDVDGDAVAVEIDSIRIVSGAINDPPNFQPPLFREMVREASYPDARRAIVLRGPARVRWYLEVPEHASLSFALAGSPRMRVKITPEGQETRELWSGEQQDRWREELIDLAAYAGQVVRLEFSAETDGEIAIAAPSIVVPMPQQELAAAQTQSVVFLLIDTMRASKLRAYEPRSRVRTPTIDQFAGEAALFEHAQAPENWTKPSVASILTSLSPMTHNTKEESSSLPPSALMVSEIFHDRGFATAAFLANGYVSDRFGFAQGWDHYTNYIREERDTRAESVFGEAGNWIAEHRDERFFVYIQTIDPHVPYDPPQEFLQMYDAQEYTGIVSPRRTGLQLEEAKHDPENYFTARDRSRLAALYDGEVSYHDREMGRFLDRLRSLGLYDRVLFVITSDHGEEFYEHGSFGHGHSVYQELLHVPLIMRWPNVIPASRIGPTVSTMDIAPTLLEATGIEIPEIFEGHSLLGAARGVPRAGPAIAFSEKLEDRRVATAAGFKLVVRGNLTSSFFDLHGDPGEQHQIDDGARFPIALRFLRVWMGQYLGAPDRGEWWVGGTGQARTLPRTDSRIDVEMCRQLRALGYVDARCDSLL